MALQDLILGSKNDFGRVRESVTGMQFPNWYHQISYHFERSKSWVSFNGELLPALSTHLQASGVQYEGSIGRSPDKNEYDTQMHLFRSQGKELLYAYSPTAELNAGSPYGLWLYYNTVHPQFEDARKKTDEFMNVSFKKL